MVARSYNFALQSSVEKDAKNEEGKKKRKREKKEKKKKQKQEEDDDLFWKPDWFDTCVPQARRIGTLRQQAPHAIALEFLGSCESHSITAERTNAAHGR